MNTFKQMGIQQWKLKQSYAQRVLTRPAGGSDNSSESDSKSSAEFESNNKQSLESSSQTSSQDNFQTRSKGELDVQVTLEAATNQYAEQSQGSGNEHKVDQNHEESFLTHVDPLTENLPIQKPIPAASMPNPTPDSALSGLDWQGLQALTDSNSHCPSCGIGNSFLGSGSPNAQWMFVVDAPTTREVSEQSLFVGRAGELFEAMLLALGLSRLDVYASSIFKCAPTSDLSATSQCNELVHRQIELIAPSVVITFGEFAAQSVIKANEGLESLRANDQRCLRTNVSVVPTYSPVQMLNDSSLKALVWKDLKKALAIVA